MPEAKSREKRCPRIRYRI